MELCFGRIGLANLGANPCKPMLGKPTVATVPPNFTPRFQCHGLRREPPKVTTQAGFPRASKKKTKTVLATLRTEVEDHWQ